jgi:hypothetical protein
LNVVAIISTLLFINTYGRHSGTAKAVVQETPDFENILQL